MTVGIRQVVALTLAAVVVGLSGCAPQGKDRHSIDLCVKDVEDQVGTSVSTSDVTASNMGDVLYEAEINDSRDLDDSDALYAVTGDVHWVKNGAEHRKSLFCLVKFNDDEPELPVEASLS